MHVALKKGSLAELKLFMECTSLDKATRLTTQT